MKVMYAEYNYQHQVSFYRKNKICWFLSISWIYPWDMNKRMMSIDDFKLYRRVVGWWSVSYQGFNVI